MNSKISDEGSSVNDVMCCANCGKAEGDDIKLKNCTACKLVKYCSVACQRNHRPQHKKACKKRAAELREDRLFRQPEGTHLGECPICCLPLPLDESKTKILINTCCSKRICGGCAHANYLHEEEEGLEHKCPYCREPIFKTAEELESDIQKRIKANDPVAICQMGLKYDREGDHEGAVRYLLKAAGLGDADAHWNLSTFYDGGEGVEKDEKKELYHLEEAAIGGHPKARHNLGWREVMDIEKCDRAEWESGFDRAVTHFVIAAKLGLDNSLDLLKKYFAVGAINKEVYEAALRGHQAAVDATKSTQREEAYAFDEMYEAEQSEAKKK